MPNARFDPQKIRQYDLSGPRYTSYPTAAEFHHGFVDEDYCAAAHRRLGSEAPLSLYVHVPFCTSPCFYCGCNRVITRSPGIGETYLRHLEIEIARQAPLFPDRGPVRQLHFGGGTPTFLNAGQLGRLMQSLDRHFGLAVDDAREFSIELDPRAVDEGTMTGLARLGFNRYSIGIQDFDPLVQHAINRRQSFEQTQSVIEQARRHGARSVSVDLIYGLPRQTVLSFELTLDQVIGLAPDRISAYSYAHLPQLFRAQNHIRESELPDPGQKLALLQCTVERLQDAGYVYIGMDHFARPGDELARALEDGSLQRNFQGYSTHGGSDLVGLGMSAISQVGDCYSQNSRTLDGYYAALDAGGLPVLRGCRLSADDQLRREVIQSILCQGALDYAAIGRRHGIDFRRYFADALETLQGPAADGLVELGEERLRVTPVGRFLLRVIAMPFDAYLRGIRAPAAETRNRYSKVI